MLPGIVRRGERIPGERTRPRVLIARRLTTMLWEGESSRWRGRHRQHAKARALPEGDGGVLSHAQLRRVLFSPVITLKDTPGERFADLTAKMAVPQMQPTEPGFRPSEPLRALVRAHLLLQISLSLGKHTSARF